MHRSIIEQPDYGNWVSTRLTVVPGVLAIVFGGLSFLLPALGILALLFLICALYFVCARHAFSARGGDIQTKVQGLLMDRLPNWDGMGKVLDVGCGSGRLTIKMAKRYPEAEAVGIDSWGPAWEASKTLCERNAAIEGVAGRSSFERASAASLPFDDESFDVVVSNMVFHEVHDVRDKKLLIEEALRVTRKGGWFVFQDLFLWKQAYGEVDGLLEAINGWGVETVEFADSSDSGFIPAALKLPFMLGTAGILYGRK